MKNKILVIGILIAVIFVGPSVFAAGQGGNINELGIGLENNLELEVENQVDGQGLQIQQQNDNEASVQVQMQNQIKNEGETNQVQNNEQEETQNQSEEVVAGQRRSIVANAVMEMLQVAERNGGIGQQIKIIAQNQNQNQEKIEASLEKAKNRSGFARFFIGPNYVEIKNAEKILEQNQEQVRQLIEIKNQLVNQGDDQILIEQIKTLEQVNLEIESSLKVERKGFSLFGWLFS